MAGRAPGRRLSVRASGRGAGSAGAREPRARRFAIVAARFHEAICKRLVDGALQAFRGGGVEPSAVDVHWVPGSFELPQAALHLATTGRYAAIVCVGVVIRGGTPHFEHVAREAASGIREVALATGVPATFGVITALTEEQAWARAGGDVANRGEEAAEAALEMADFVERTRGRPNVGPRSPAQPARRWSARTSGPGARRSRRGGGPPERRAPEPGEGAPAAKKKRDG